MQKGNMFIIALFLELLYMEISTPNRIQIAICENMFPKLSVKISSNRLTTPNNNPIKNIAIGFSSIFLNKAQLLFSNVSSKKIFASGCLLLTGQFRKRHSGGQIRRSHCSRTTIAKKHRDIFSNTSKNFFPCPGYSRVYNLRLMTEASEPITKTSPAVSSP